MSEYSRHLDKQPLPGDLWVAPNMLRTVWCFGKGRRVSAGDHPVAIDDARTVGELMQGGWMPAGTIGKLISALELEDARLGIDLRQPAGKGEGDG